MPVKGANLVIDLEESADVNDGFYNEQSWHIANALHDVAEREADDADAEFAWAIQGALKNIHKLIEARRSAIVQGAIADANAT